MLHGGFAGQRSPRRGLQAFAAMHIAVGLNVERDAERDALGTAAARSRHPPAAVLFVCSRAGAPARKKTAQTAQEPAC